MVGNVRVNITDEKPSILFVSWYDIKKMVLDDISTYQYSDELLELDY